MARLPAYTNKTGLDIGSDTFRNIGPAAPLQTGEGQIAQGLANLGTGITNLGVAAGKEADRLAKEEEARSNQAAGWNDEMQFIQLRDRVNQFAEDHKEKVGGDGAGYTKAVDDYARAEYSSLAASGNLSRKNPQQNDLVFERLRSTATNSASQWEVGTKNQFRSAISEDRVKGAISIAALKGAEGQDEAQKDWLEFVDRTQGVNTRNGQLMLQFGNKRIERAALEAEAAKRDGGREFVAKFQGVFSETPSATTNNPLVNSTLKYAPALGVDPKAMVAAGWIESRLDPNHQGPRLPAGAPEALGRKGKTHMSSAEGGWQFLDGDVRAAGLLITDKFDPDKSTQLMANRYANNQRVIQGFGREPTPGTLYMMHNVGEGVGRNILKADPDTPIETVIYRSYPSNPAMAAQVLRNNPSMYRSGMTVGQVVNNYERQVGIALKQTEGYFNGSQTGTDQQANAAASSFMGREIKYLSTADVAEVFANVSKNVKTASKEDNQIAQGSYYLSNPGTADQYDSSHKAAVNAAFEARYGSQIVDGVSQGDRQSLSVLTEATRSAGFIPDKALHGVRAALNGGSTPAAATVLVTLNDIDKNNPRALDATALTPDDREAINSYASYTGVLGMDPHEATKRIMYERSPEGKKVKEAFAEKFKAEWRNGTHNDVEADAKNWKDIASHLSKGQWFNSDAASDVVRETMTESYKRGIQAHRLQGRDLETSKALALDQLDKVWGNSTASSSKGESLLTMYPPEKVLGRDKMLDGSFDWVQKQAQFQLRRYLVQEGKLKNIIEDQGAPDAGSRSFVGYDKTPEFRLIAAPGSSADLNAGRPISYQMWYTDESGRKQIARGEVYTPNYTDAKLHSDIAARKRRDERQALRDASSAMLNQQRAEGVYEGPQ